VAKFVIAGLERQQRVLEEIAALVVRRMGAERMLEFASQNLAKDF
jgi:hypothetical protein